MMQYVYRVPVPSDYPALMLDATRSLTPAIVSSYLRAALTALSFSLAQQVTVHSLRRSGPVLPCYGMMQYVYRVPVPSDYPALMLDATRSLTPAIVSSYLRAALTALSFSLAQQVTVHSLRRSGARECALHGAPEDHVKRHGRWTSSAIYSYTPRRLFSLVPQTFTKMLGQ